MFSTFQFNLYSLIIPFVWSSGIQFYFLISLFVLLGEIDFHSSFLSFILVLKDILDLQNFTALYIFIGVLFFIIYWGFLRLFIAFYPLKTFPQILLVSVIMFLFFAFYPETIYQVYKSIPPFSFNSFVSVLFIFLLSTFTKKLAAFFCIKNENFSKLIFMLFQLSFILLSSFLNNGQANCMQPFTSNSSEQLADIQRALRSDAEGASSQPTTAGTFIQPTNGGASSQPTTAGTFIQPTNGGTFIQSTPAGTLTQSAAGGTFTQSTPVGTFTHLNAGGTGGQVDFTPVGTDFWGLLLGWLCVPSQPIEIIQSQSVSVLSAETSGFSEPGTPNTSEARVADEMSHPHNNLVFSLNKMVGGVFDNSTEKWMHSSIESLFSTTSIGKVNSFSVVEIFAPKSDGTFEKIVLTGDSLNEYNLNKVLIDKLTKVDPSMPQVDSEKRVTLGSTSDEIVSPTSQIMPVVDLRLPVSAGTEKMLVLMSWSVVCLYAPTILQIVFPAAAVIQGPALASILVLAWATGTIETGYIQNADGEFERAPARRK